MTTLAAIFPFVQWLQSGPEVAYAPAVACFAFRSLDRSAASLRTPKLPAILDRARAGIFYAGGFSRTRGG